MLPRDPGSFLHPSTKAGPSISGENAPATVNPVDIGPAAAAAAAAAADFDERPHGPPAAAPAPPPRARDAAPAPGPQSPTAEPDAGPARTAAAADVVAAGPPLLWYTSR